MKIVLLLFQFLPTCIGGSELAAFHFAKRLSKKGHEVHVITRLDARDLSPHELVEGFHVHRIKRWHIRIIGSLLYFFLVYDLIKKLKPDIIHEQAIQGMGPFIKRFFKIPYIIFPRGSDLYLASSYYQKYIVKSTLKSADIILAQTKDMVKEINKYIHRGDIKIIPNGVDLDRFNALSKNTARKNFGINEKEQIILCVANLRQEKGHEYLVKAMESVIVNCPNTRLFLVGRDFQKGKIQNLINHLSLQKKVIFSGFVPNDEIPNYMVAADLFVLPSLSEGFPNALLEALAAGLPLVATNVGGVSEILENGKNGFLVTSGNSQQISDKIIFLLQNKKLREQISANNIEKAKNYNWSEIIDFLEEVYFQAKKR